MTITLDGKTNFSSIKKYLVAFARNNAMAKANRVKNKRLTSVIPVYLSKPA